MSFLVSQVAKSVRPLLKSDGSTTPAGKFLLSLENDQMEELLRSKGNDPRCAPEITAVFVAHAPSRWKKLLEALSRKGDSKHLHPSTWTLALESAPSEFLEPAANEFELLEDWDKRFKLGEKLHAIDPARFSAAMEAFTSAQLLAKDTKAHLTLWTQARDSACWLAANHKIAALPLLEKYFSSALDREDFLNQMKYKLEALVLAVEKLGRDALPLIEACFLTEQLEVQLWALQIWAKIKINSDSMAAAAKIRRLLASPNSSCVARTVRIAGDLFPEAVEEELWALLSYKSKPVREASAATLAKFGDSRLDKTKLLWAARKADTRLAAVAWLQAIGTNNAAEALKARLDEEEEDKVRDSILLALEKLEGNTVETHPGEWHKRIKKTLEKITRPPAPWLELDRLPSPKLINGTELSREWLLYLLYRQSRVKEMRPDIEARPLYAQLDRKTSGDLALAVLQSFFKSMMNADDRWAMAFAAIIGDDRLVPVLTRQIKEWADHMRGKLAEYAVQSLALLGTDAALLAVDAMAIRYRSKNKNIGKAASEAFAEAARIRGLTVEELGDLVVPWLGFTPGQPRIMDTGKTKLEVHIGNDFKLTLRDAITNKKVSKLPDSAPAGVKSEFKELSAGLKEAVKSQLLRMETLMVRQFHLKSLRWQELYLQHPLLFPFAQRLVWAAYDNANTVVGTFRALEDHSLTDAADEAINLPKDCTVGVAHPLELTPEIRQGWLRHLADYDIIPPFAQLERPVVMAQPEQKAILFGDEIAGTELNALTFKGRAERLGWSRGSVCDAGCVNYYVKSFPNSGVDVFIGLEGMYVGIDMYSSIRLRYLFFVKHGSVQIGSYVYDEPTDAGDQRLVSYGAVPPIAFSEAMGDLTRIADMNKSESES
jgi:hypothetical protein